MTTRSGFGLIFATGSRSSTWSGDGEDAADRVWAVRRSGSSGARAPEARDVRLPGIHAYLRDDQEWAVRAQAGHEQEAVAGEATRGQDRADATPPPTHPRAGAMAGERRAGTRQLLRRIGCER